jgi:hypothetical protein
MRFSIRTPFAVIVAVLALAVPTWVFSAGTTSDQNVQNASLLAAVVIIGGGPERFSATTFRRGLASAVPDEEKSLRQALGTANVDRFDEVFTYVVTDALATLRRTVAAALYKAGLRGSAFDVERCFDVLFSPDVHEHAMLAVGRKYGSAGENAYHTVFARLVEDTGKS